MHVLHCLWAREGHLAVWAEDSDRADEAFAGRAPRRTARPPRHPFAAEASDVAALLELPADPATEQRDLLLWLPVTAGRPQPSPAVPLEDRRKVGRPERILPWSVPAVAMPVESGLPLLVTPPEQSTRLVLGSGWHELGQVALLALTLVTSGRILPGLTRLDSGRADSGRADSGRADSGRADSGRADSGWKAVWHPVPTPAQRSDLRRLAHELPASLRAEESTGRAPLEVVEEALAALADHAVRSSVRRGETTGRSPGGTLDLWLEALSGSPEISGGSPELTALADAAEGWLRDASPAEGALRTCFRLVAPSASDEPAVGDDEDVWILEYHLQSVEDPSLLVPAESVWSLDETGLGDLGAEHPQDTLLRDLGTACRVYPPLAESLDAAAPKAWVTDVAGAGDFLVAGAEALERNGFGVLLPEWSRRPRRLGVRLEARDTAAAADDETADSGVGSGRLGVEALVEFDWRLSLGDDPITEDELERLAELKAPLVRVRGRWTWLTQEAVDAALEFVKRRGAGGEEDAPGLVDVLRLAADLDSGEGRTPGGLPVLGIDAGGELAGVLAGDVGPIRPAEIPDSFRGSLRPYQERGVAWLAWLGRLRLGGCLADDMGLGKTVQLLALLAAQGSGAGPTLLVCPTSVLGNWVREVERFVPSLEVLVNHGPGRARGDDLVAAAAATDLLLTSYALADRDRDALSRVPWARVVLDEAQHAKNPKARQSRAVRHIADSSGACRIALTGTPVENRLGDLWSLMAFLNPGLLGSARSFREAFAVPIERYGDTEVLDRLGTLVRPFLLRRVKSDPGIAPELPEKIERNEICLLTREQASLYRSVTDEMLGRVGELDADDPETRASRRGIVLAAMLRLKQICNHPALYLDDGSGLAGRSGKLDRLEELVDVILAEGDRVLVFTQFAGWGGTLRRRLQEVTGREILFLHGGTQRRRRDEMVERFQSPAGPPVFVMSLKAGGVGLNLTAATHVVHYDRWWNPAVENQATDRAYRIGQTRGVDVHRFVCAGTIEERVGELMADKQRLAEAVVGSGEGWLAGLDLDELSRIVSLEEGA